MKQYNFLIASFQSGRNPKRTQELKVHQYQKEMQQIRAELTKHVMDILALLAC